MAAGWESSGSTSPLRYTSSAVRRAASLLLVFGNLDGDQRKAALPGRSLGRADRQDFGRSGTPALSLESFGLRSAHYQLWRGQYQLEDYRYRSARRLSKTCPVDKGQRWRYRQHPARRLRHSLFG